MKLSVSTFATNDSAVHILCTKLSLIAHITSWHQFCECIPTRKHTSLSTAKDFNVHSCIEYMLNHYFYMLQSSEVKIRCMYNKYRSVMVAIVLVFVN